MGFDGLDTVELIMSIEDAFGISIPDREAERLTTLGQLHDYLIQRLSATTTQPPTCLTAAAFYRTRRIIADHFRLPLKSIRPHTNIDPLLPPTDRRNAWRAFSKQMGGQLGGLLSPKWLKTLACALYLAFLLTILLVVASPSLRPVTARLVLILPIALLALLPLRFVLATQVHPRFATAGLLSNILVPSEVTRRHAPGAPWSQLEIWQIISSLTAENAGVPVARLTRETSFITDL